MRFKSILSMLSAMTIVLVLGTLPGPANGEARRQAPAAKQSAWASAGTAVLAWNQIAVTPSSGFRAPPAEPRRPRRSTWRWFRERSMTRSTRSSPSTTGRTS